MKVKDYVNFENGSVELINLFNITKSDIDNLKYDPAPLLWDVIIWLKDVHHILVIVDYEYECTDKSYYYKIYRLKGNGRPERVEVTGVRYDKDGNPHNETIGYRDYIRSCEDYAGYEEALMEGIKYCLMKL